MDFKYEKATNLTLEKSLSLEWLETNGLGGYASSTILNSHTRKYHGLLVIQPDASPNRYVLLSKLEDCLLKDGNEHYLTAAQYPGHLETGSFDHLNRFEQTTHPCAVYEFEDITLTREILMPQDENTVLIKYSLKKGERTKLRLRPFLAFRNVHELMHQHDFLNPQVHAEKQGFYIKPYEAMPALYFSISGLYELNIHNVWYQDFQYLEEKNRGFDFQEDLFSPGTFEIELTKDQDLIIAATTDEKCKNPTKKWLKEIKNREKQPLSDENELKAQLKKAARTFIRQDPKDQTLSIIAGYHWFGAWGRDTMIALPGLLEHNALSKTETLAILKTFASHENQGLIPNFLGKTPEENAYNSVDASLFFAWAVQVYYTQTNDLKAIKKHFWPTLKHIFQHYKQGTLHNIKMNEKGLIEAGDEQTNLTWMDAMVNGKPSSPRYGAIVEINALWFNMLCFMQTLADTFKDSALEKEITPIIQILKKSFTQTFWDEDLGCLKDFVAQDKESRAIRPNQLFAISLPYSPITKTMAKKILKTVQDHLLTPYGLRTLSPNDPDYIGIYSGDSHHRDKAYHNGTVWPWLLGPFTQALLKTLPKAQTTKILEPCRKALKDHLFEAGIGTISEVFDGDAPHNPNGCISQAWSISEILRLSEFFNK